MFDLYLIIKKNCLRKTREGRGNVKYKREKKKSQLRKLGSISVFIFFFVENCDSIDYTSSSEAKRFCGAGDCANGCPA